MVEISFALGATLTRNFNGAFSKASQALNDLSKHMGALNKTSGQVNAFQKMQGSMMQTAEKLNIARAKVKELGLQMRNTATPTEAMKRQFTAANVEANRLQQSLENQRRKLGELRTNLTGAGVDTKNLAAEQSRLTLQSQRVAEAQDRLQKSRMRFAQTRQNLSWNNIKGELLTAAGLGYSLYKPVSQAADFEQAMARVNAVAFSGGGRDKVADAEAFKALQEQARQLGRDTQFTAVQAAQSQENLARAGFQTNEIISAMPGLLDMAAAEGMDLATAADITTSALRGFKLNADQSNRVADVLAQTSAASNTNISMLGESLKMCAPQAAGLGVSIEQTAAMLGVMANNGIKGTESGTALRNVFLRLSQEPKAVAKALSALGIASRDAKGNMRELPDLLIELHEKIKNYGKADQMKYLANIFGARSVTGAMALMNGAVDGSLQNLEWLEKEANGVMTAILEHVNKGSKESVVSLEEMRAGMSESGKYAEKLGVSYKDLTISLGLLARGGIKGAQADKGLTVAFQQLLEQPKKVQAALKQFDISIYNDDGKMKEFPALLGEIKKSVMGITDQTKRLNLIESIFGKGSGPVIQALLKSMTDETLAKYNEVADGAVGVSKEMAEKVNNTMRGAWTKASSAVSDLMITVGDVLLPNVTSLVNSFKEFTTWIGKLAHENPKWTKAIVGTVGAFAALKVGMVGLKIGWNLLRSPFDAMKVAMDVMHVKSLTGAKDLAEQTKRAGLFSRVGKGISNGFKGIGKAFSALGKGIGLLFKNMFSMGKNLVSNLFSPLGLKIMAIVGIIAAVAAAVYLIYKNWDKIKEWWNSWTLKDVFAAVGEYTSRAVNWAKEKWQEFSEWWNSWSLKDIFAGVADFFGIDPHIFDGIVRAWEAAKGILTDSWNAFCKIFVISFDGFWDGLATGLELIRPVLAKGWELLTQLLTFDFSGMWDTLSSGFISVCETIKGVWNGVCDFIGEAWEKVSEAISGAWSWTKSLFGYDVEGEELQTQLQDITALNKMSEGFTQRVAEMTKAWQPFKSSLAEGFEQIYSTMQGVADKIRGVTIPAVNDLASSLSKIATEIRSIVQAGDLTVDVKTTNTGVNVSRTAGGRNKSGWWPHAEGGIFSTPHLGLVAEAGREAIIPLEDKVRGIPLWKAAGEEMGLRFGSFTTNNNTSNTNSQTSISPIFNITVNGGDDQSGNRLRGIIEDILLKIQNDGARLSFA